MRKAALLLFMTMVLLSGIAGCAGMQAVQPDAAFVQRTVDVQGASRDRLFDLSKGWIAQNIPADSKGTDALDRSAGTITYHGLVAMPTNALTEIMEKRLIRFVFFEEIKDGGARITFNNISLVTPETYNSYTGWSGGRERPVRTVDELTEVRYVLGGLAVRLEKYLSEVGGAK